MSESLKIKYPLVEGKPLQRDSARSGTSLPGHWEHSSGASQLSDATQYNFPTIPHTTGEPRTGSVPFRFSSKPSCISIHVCMFVILVFLSAISLGHIRGQRFR